MKDITIQDCYDLRHKFEQYCDRAEQHEFTMLLVIDTRMLKTISDLKKDSDSISQNELRTMFRVVCKIIGEDASEYEESKHNDGNSKGVNFNDE